MTKTVKTTAVIGINNENAAMPNAGINPTSICSVPYADDEIGSDERTPRAYRFFNLWWPKVWRFSGAPSRNFLIR